MPEINHFLRRTSLRAPTVGCQKGKEDNFVVGQIANEKTMSVVWFFICKGTAMRVKIYEKGQRGRLCGNIHVAKRKKVSHLYNKGWGLSVKLGKHSAIWGKLGTALQAYTLSPCTKFPPNPTSRKVNT